MRTLPYLAYALSLRRSSHTPNSTTCAPTIGIPGGVYLCSGDATCRWIPPGEAAACISYDIDALGPPVLIGPDHGGYCRMYSREDCDDDWVMSIAGDVVDKAGDKTLADAVICPGIGGKDVPEGMRALRCWGVKGKGGQVAMG